MPSTYQLLQQLPDAREASDSGRPDVLAAVLEEIGVDGEKPEIVCRRRSHRLGLISDAWLSRPEDSLLLLLGNRAHSRRLDVYAERDRLAREGMSYYGINRSVAEEQLAGAKLRAVEQLNADLAAGRIRGLRYESAALDAPLEGWPPGDTD